MPTEEVIDQQTEGTEEHSEEQAGTEESGVEETTEEDVSEELLDSETYERVKDDPKALEKELRKAFTQKTQKLSATQKTLEPYTTLVQALEDSPVETLKALGSQFGLKFEGGTEKQTEKKVADLSTKITEKFKAALGEDYGDLADKLGAAVHESLLEAIPELTKGVEDKVDKVVSDSSQREADLTLERFTETHPDWKKHEAAMESAMKKFPPSTGTDALEYLEGLYLIATKGQSVGSEVKKVVDRMAKSAQKSKPRDATSDKQVSRTPVKAPTFAEAAAAALRGERFE